MFPKRMEWIGVSGSRAATGTLVTAAVQVEGERA